jgi:class 3 adenylate cyclase
VAIPGQRLLDRVGNPLEWPEIDRALIIQAIQVPGTLVMMIRARHLLAHPEIEPYFDRATLGILSSFMIGFMLLTLGFTMVGLHLRRTEGPHRLYLHAVNQSWWLAFAFIAYMHGLATTPLWVIFPFFGFFCLLLFDARLTAAGALSALAVIYALTVAERLGLVPYGPFFRDWPVVEGRVADTWLWWVMLWPVALSGVTFVVFAFILERARRQAARVAQMSELLKQMFGRYISTEVMRTLLDEPGSFALGGERRRVTILMTDLRGFTALAERLPPEEVIALLNSYFEVMIEVCMRRGGTINELIGDALLVTFGAPKPMADHCAAAVACAIEMQNAMQDVNAGNLRRRRPELSMGIGVNTAEVIVGNLGSEKRSSFSVVGSGVNMTSRIESFAVGGEILASQSVVDEIGGLLRIDDRREVRPKGATTPITIYKVGGIAGSYGVALESSDAELVRPARQLAVRYVSLSGELVDGDCQEATVLRVSRTGMELAVGPAVGILEDIRLNLMRGSAQLTSLDVYAKVVAVDDDGRVRLRFTSTPPEVLMYFEGLLGG